MTLTPADREWVGRQMEIAQVEERRTRPPGNLIERLAAWMDRKSIEILVHQREKIDQQLRSYPPKI